MTWAQFRTLEKKEATRLLLDCCHCQRFATELAERRAEFADAETLKRAAEAHFLSLGEDAWLEAFAGHPKIGDLSALRKKFAGDEQGAVAAASEEVLRELKKLNEDYEHKFGFIFIICATGKSAAEMLVRLKDRLHNERNAELHNAALEQAKILRIRMDKLL